jgi:hypothetical protein
MATRTRNRRFARAPATISPKSASRRRRTVGLTLEVLEDRLTPSSLGD